MNQDYTHEDIQLAPDYEGEVKAVLTRFVPSLSNSKAVLYIHGFMDYFFQTHLAEFYMQNGFAFYALDLRKCGRSLLPHQRPNFALSFTEYYEELEYAVNTIKEKHDFLLLNGHSTGTLSCSLFCREHPAGKKVDALFLNSPFFAFPYSTRIRNLLIPLVRFAGLYFPYQKVPAVYSKNYGISLHKDYKGEWEYDLRLKPVKSYPIYAGWILAAHRAQKRMRRGIGSNLPVLVFHSNKSINKFTGSIEELHSADAVLNVDDMRKYSKNLSSNVTEIEIDAAVHDVFLSKKPVREKAFEELANRLRHITESNTVQTQKEINK